MRVKVLQWCFRASGFFREGGDIDSDTTPRYIEGEKVRGAYPADLCRPGRQTLTDVNPTPRLPKSGQADLKRS
jgi:hypothetical protein